MAATDAGLAAVPAQPPARGAEIIDGFRAMLSAYQNALFEPLLSAPTESLTREEWAERAGKSRTSSTFDNETAQMRAIGVIETESGGRVRLASRLAALL
jgi:predicted transcriptional regulator